MKDSILACRPQGMTTNTGPGVKQDLLQREGGGAAFCQGAGVSPWRPACQLSTIQPGSFISTENCKSLFTYGSPERTLNNYFVTSSKVFIRMSNSSAIVNVFVCYSWICKYLDILCDYKITPSVQTKLLISFQGRPEYINT